MKVIWLLFYIFVSFMHADIQIDDKEINQYYKKWKENFLVCEKDKTCRIATDKKDKHRTVSEAQGYGMLITVSMADHDLDVQKTFDGLWKFSRAHLSPISKNLMSWEVPEKAGENDSAFDGDADIAYALILAHNKWGSKGRVNYKKEALKVLDSIWKFTIGVDSYLPLLGDWVDQSGKKFNQYTVRTSDFMPNHFKLFYKFTGDKKWLKVVFAVQKAMLDVQNQKTGLIPDFIKYDKKYKHFVAAEEGFLEHHDGAYYYNGCRIPFRMGVDALNGNKVSQQIVTKLSHWIKESSKGDPLKIKSGFELNGKVIGNYFSIVFAAPFGVSAMVDDKIWAKKIYDVVKNRHENYYEDSVALLSMLAMKGYFKTAK
jgi:endo-1,4-beta-D-glucanase Y